MSRISRADSLQRALINKIMLKIALLVFMFILKVFLKLHLIIFNLKHLALNTVKSLVFHAFVNIKVVLK